MGLLGQVRTARSSAGTSTSKLPFERTSIGIDSLDLELDLLVTPELAVFVKDEEHVDESAALGRFTTEDAAAIHAVGATLKAQIEREGAWWDQAWSTWTPPAELRLVPPLADGWEGVRGTVFAELAGR